MADKKITELQLLTDAAQNDRLVIVDDPSGTPITKQITVSKLFGNVNFITDTTTNSVSLIKSVVTANTNGNTVVAGDFSVTSTATSANTNYQYGLRVSSGLVTSTAKVTQQHASAKFILNVSNAAAENVISNTYVALLQVANTDTRTANVQAFVGFGDAASNSTSAQTLYLFDIGLNATANVSANISSGAANATTLFSNSAATTATHKLRIRVNGTDYWLLATDTAS